MVALEPEAASLFCRHLPVEKCIGPDKISLSSMTPGLKYMVLDCGGEYFSICTGRNVFQDAYSPIKVTITSDQLQLRAYSLNQTKARFHHREYMLPNYGVY